jgi:hypothetical protein
MFCGGDDFDVLEPRRFQAVGDELRRPRHVSLVVGIGADAGDSQEGKQLFQETFFVLFDEGLGRLRHTPL